MNRLSLSFFSAAAVCIVGGMIWGILMAQSNDHTMMPAHAHLNLLGWATLALMGTFYALTGRSGRLGWVNFGLSTLAVVVSIPALALVLGGNTGMTPVAIVGALLALLGALTFGLSVFGAWREAPAS